MVAFGPLRFVLNYTMSEVIFERVEEHSGGVAAETGCS